VEVRHGTLLNVHGRPARSDGYIFMPAHVRLDGESCSLDHRLRDHRKAQETPVLRVPIARGFDSAWVRARIPTAFGFTPEPAEVEKSLIHLGFAAVDEGAAVCYPFHCIDHYGRSGLEFSDDGPEESIKRSIAEAFWDVLIQDPDDLTDFEERVYHPGAMSWLCYGCLSGHVFCEEESEE
jgi:hypothetical protein